MAPLARTLALLAMTVATVAIKVVPLDTAQDSFDDQYRGCSCAMTRELLDLNHSEFQKNLDFARVWSEAKVEWVRRGSHVYPFSSQDYAIAITAYTMDIDGMFNGAVRVAGRSRQEYRDNFHFKSLHFLLTNALARLRNVQKVQCLDVFYQDCGVLFKAQRGDTVRFGQFFIMSLNKTTCSRCSVETLLQVHTCHSAGIQQFSEHPEYQWVLIPPFETFEVTEVTQAGNKAQIQLRSTGAFSKYNCEWLKGGSIARAPFNLGRLLLATTALAVATGIL